MAKFPIQRYVQNLTIPINDDTVTSELAPLNGIIRGIITDAPTLTAANYDLRILDNDGVTQFTLAAQTNNQRNAVYNDSNNYPLQVPVANTGGFGSIQLHANSDAKATGVLTSNQTNALNNETVTIGTRTYTFKLTLTGAADEILIAPNVAATQTLTSSNVNVSDADVVVVGATTYRFKNTMAQINDVQIGVDADTSLTNLAAAINGSAGAGTLYFTGTTANAQATSSAPVVHVLTLTAKTAGPSGSAIPLTTTAATLTPGGATFAGGSYSGDMTLLNFKKAINNEATAGTNYGTGTVINADVSAGAVTSHSVTVTAKVIPDTAVVTISTSAAFTWGAAHLVGGGEASARAFKVQLLLERRG